MRPYFKREPFPPNANEDPRGHTARFFDGYPLGQDPLGWALASTCDMDALELHGPVEDFDHELVQQLDALRCDQIFTYPASHPERIDWQESATWYDVNLTTWSVSGRSITYEVARLEVPLAGILRVEEIATYAHIVISEEAVLLAGVQSGDITPTITQPFPFPLTVNGLNFTWTWELVHQWVGDGRGPQWAVGIPRARAVPATHQLRTPWADNRYAWGSSWSTNKQYTVGSGGVVRLFVTLTSTSDPRAFSFVRIGGGLKGFSQSAGRDAAAVHNTIRRDH